MADVIASAFTTNGAGYTSFLDTRVADFLGTNNDAIQAARLELQARGYLVPLTGAAGQQPNYSMSVGAV